MYYQNASIKRMHNRKGKPWRGTLQYKDENGKWRQKTRVFPGIERKADALLALNQWRMEMEVEAEGAQLLAESLQQNDSDFTVEQAVRAELLHQRKLGIVSLGTYQKQLAQAMRGIFPIIGERHLTEMDRKDMQEYIDHLATQMKPSTVRNYYSIMNKTFNEALRRDVVAVNPCALITLPRTERASISYLDTEGRSRFLSEIVRLSETDVLRMAASLAFCTGMRAGEVCGLQWRDVDLEHAELHVNRGARRVKDSDGRNRVTLGPPKTPTGVRMIPLLPQASQTLNTLKRRGHRRIQPDDFVLGQLSDPALLCANFYAWSKRNGVISATGKPATMHCLRHTFATIGVQSGMDVKSLSSILGHARTDMTLNVYASADDQAKRAAMQNLGRLLRDQGAM